jgi:hypothetical protein
VLGLRWRVLFSYCAFRELSVRKFVEHPGELEKFGLLALCFDGGIR